MMLTLPTLLGLALTSLVSPPHARWRSVEHMSVQAADLHGRLLDIAQVNNKVRGEDDAPPDKLHIAFSSDEREYAFEFLRVSVFSDHARILLNVNGTQQVLRPSPQRTYAYHDGAGSWARAVLREDGATSVLVNDAGQLFLLERVSSLRNHGVDIARNAVPHSYHRLDLNEHGDSTQQAKAAAHGDSGSGSGHECARPTKPIDADAGLHGQHVHVRNSTRAARAHNRRTLEQSSVGRMAGCPAQPKLLEMKIGIVIDRGYRIQLGGHAAAIEKAAEIVLNTNAVYEIQVGVTFKIDRLILTMDNFASFAESGPNYKPSIPGERNTCASPMRDGNPYTSDVPLWQGLTSSNDKTAPVLGKGHVWMLNELSHWSAVHAPAASTGGPLAAWHLLTNCFPAPGVVGFANNAGVCGSSAGSSRKLFIKDTGKPPANADRWDYMMPNGNEGTVIGYAEGAGCSEAWAPCAANTAITSYSDDLSLSPTWRTFAHEMGHLFGAMHTTKAQGGLMSHSADTWFYDNDQVCDKFNDVLTLSVGRSDFDCAVTATSTCGNGVRETDERCDDGNTVDGDGCDSSCTEEPGWRCTEDPVSGRSTCEKPCGNGIVDKDMFEECDEAGKRCVECRRPPGWECTPRGNPCCNPDGRRKFVGEKCRKDGVCNKRGKCERAIHPPDNFCEAAYDPAGRVWVTDPVACPAILTPELACSPRCRKTTNGQCGFPNFADIGARRSYYLGGRCSFKPDPDSAELVEGHCAPDPVDSKRLLCTTSQCGDGVREGTEECDDDTPCCDKKTCKLKLHAVCTPGSNSENECCDNSCVYKLPSATCGGGLGWCSMGNCAHFMKLCSTFSDLELNPEQCPLLGGPTVGCMQRCAWKGSAFGCRTVGEPYTLPAGHVCDRGGGELGICADATHDDGSPIVVCAEAPLLALKGVLPPAPPPPSPSPPPTGTTGNTVDDDGGSDGDGSGATTDKDSLTLSTIVAMTIVCGCVGMLLIVGLFYGVRVLMQRRASANGKRGWLFVSPTSNVNVSSIIARVRGGSECRGVSSTSGAAAGTNVGLSKATIEDATFKQASHPTPPPPPPREFPAATWVDSSASVTQQPAAVGPPSANVHAWMRPPCA